MKNVSRAKIFSLFLLTQLAVLPAAVTPVCAADNPKDEQAKLAAALPKAN